jgi:hypothetical protein
MSPSGASLACTFPLIRCVARHCSSCCNVSAARSPEQTAWHACCRVQPGQCGADGTRRFAPLLLGSQHPLVHRLTLTVKGTSSTRRPLPTLREVRSPQASPWPTPPTPRADQGCVRSAHCSMPSRCERIDLMIGTAMACSWCSFVGRGSQSSTLAAATLRSVKNRAMRGRRLRRCAGSARLNRSQRAAIRSAHVGASAGRKDGCQWHTGADPRKIRRGIAVGSSKRSRCLSVR